jgi:hypothetical protein
MLRKMPSVFAIAAVMTLVMASYAHAFVFTKTLDPQHTSGSQRYVSWSFSVFPIIDGDATLSLTFDGDFDRTNEYANVRLYPMDGTPRTNVGRVLDGKPNNDPFDFSNGDAPSTFPATGTATISEAEMAPLISNGYLGVVVYMSNRVASGATISGLLSWDPEYGSTSVPEPPTIALCAIALAVLGFVTWGRRRPA